MATHSSVLAWRSPRTEEPGGLQSVGSQESDTTERLPRDFLCAPTGVLRGFLDPCSRVSGFDALVWLQRLEVLHVRACAHACMQWRTTEARLAFAFAASGSGALCCSG